MSHALAQFSPVPDSPSFRGAVHAVWRWLYVHNPLYLVSACFVLHGAALLLPQTLDATVPYNPWPLLGLSAAYLLALALAAIAIVRLGTVWDDARSILLLVLGMFTALSLSLDAPLTQNVQFGRILLVAGFFYAALLSELLAHGLGIRLPALFRFPFHGLLALVYLYPLWLVPSISARGVLSIPWRVYLFSPAAALVLLTLWPAIRRGAGYVRHTGSPWQWPWYPWAIFVTLGVGVCLRGYVLSLSFHPVQMLRSAEAMPLQSAYGAYCLVPIFLSAALLVLETGLVSGSAKAQRLALAIPALCIGLSFPDPTPNAAYAEFLEDYMNQLASPVLVSAIAALVFYGVALVRSVAFAEGALVLTLMGTACLGPGTISLKTTTDPGWSVLALLCAFQLLRGIQKRDSRRAFVGLISGIVALRTTAFDGVSGFVREFVCVHLAVAALLLLGILFRDRFAQGVRKVGAILLLLLCLAALLTPVNPLESVSWGIPAYICLVTGLAFLWGYCFAEVLYIWSASLSALAWSVSLLWQAYRELRVIAEWPGIRSFLLGFLVLALATGMSLVKGGAFSGTRLPPARAPDEDESDVEG